MKRYIPLLVPLMVAVVFASCKKTIPDAPVTLPPVDAQDTVGLQQYQKDITLVNWNIEWFGNAALFKGDLSVQQENAGKILKYLNADLYAICEVVDTARLGSMVRNNLGDAFRYVVSFYPTVLNAQKLAFVYNRNIFRKVSVRPFMGTSTTAYYNFAQRFPYLLTADVVVNNQRIPMSFIVLHAKANADADSYYRRLNGAVELKDSLDRYFVDKHVVIMGDFNDHLTGSILPERVSPYENFIKDTARYNAITLPLNARGYQSTITYANSVIDQQIISTAMNKWYSSGSAAIRTDITSVVPDYTSGNTSDHYPVSSRYSIK